MGSALCLLCSLAFPSTPVGTRKQAALCAPGPGFSVRRHLRTARGDIRQRKESQVHLHRHHHSRQQMDRIRPRKTFRPATGCTAESLIGYDSTAKAPGRIRRRQLRSCDLCERRWMAGQRSLTMTSTGLADQKAPYAANRFLYSVIGQDSIYSGLSRCSRAAALDCGAGRSCSPVTQAGQTAKFTSSPSPSTETPSRPHSPRTSCVCETPALCAALQAVVQQNRPSARSRRLHQGRHLPRIHWIDPRIAVSRKEEDRRIFRPRLHVLVRRILQNVRISPSHSPPTHTPSSTVRPISNI